MTRTPPERTLNTSAPPIVLLAAGRSTRFGTLKQVAPVGPTGASILAYTALDALEAGFGEVVLVTRDEVRLAILAHLADHLGDRLPIRTVDQSEPLGTGHAVLTAGRVIEGRFGVANGDDFYGRDALAALRAVLHEFSSGSSAAARAALVGYRMADTLSAHGGVSRGYIESDAQGVVTGITEVHQVQQSSAADSPLSGNVGTTKIDLPSDAWASMNLWGLSGDCVPLLEREFDQWLTQPTEVRGEFAISTVLDDLRLNGELRVDLNRSGREWFGLTFAPDAEQARGRLAAKHADGTYPVSLREMADRHRS